MTPKFKIGDEVRSKNPEFTSTAIITDIKDNSYFYQIYNTKDKATYIGDWGIKEMEENCIRLTKLEKALK